MALLLLDPRVNPTALENKALETAVRHNHLDILKVLLNDPRINSSDFDNKIIRTAIECSNLEIIEFLLTDPQINTIDEYELAEEVAEDEGYYEIVKILNQDRIKYPTYEIRKHNLPLDNRIQELDEFDIEERFYIRKFQEIRNMHDRDIPVNIESEMVINLHLQILNSEKGKLKG